ncbi:porin [Marinomonas sp. IMCC 4694]|uniref:porin n=1 Tax=Marinomonas sp. IMCC 4694 TaxID=2605432 RepID=UPI0011E7DE94|nr:porin [Marinomonas sp. IMCC 4694]TYL48657.1 porin [Marinomonas sp. IMCC 4694]
MKKTIIAIAVSSAAFASLPAQAAEGSSVDVYGNIQFAYSDKDAGTDLEDNGSTIGVKGETKVSDDLTAFFKYELEFKADQTEGRDSNNTKGYNESKLDQAFVGLQGNFGIVQIGSFDTIYNNAIQDTVDQFEYLGMTSADGTSEGDTITYFSPSMNGFEVQVAAQVKGDTTSTDNIDDEEDGASLMGVLKYSTDLVSVALGYDTRENTSTDPKATTGLAVTVMPMDSLSVTAKYETTEDTQDIYGLAARYGYGAGDVYASYQNINPDAAGSEDYNEYAAGVTYSLASNVYVFGEVGKFENASNSDTDTQTAVGVYYGF